MGGGASTSKAIPFVPGKSTEMTQEQIEKRKKIIEMSPIKKRMDKAIENTNLSDEEKIKIRDIQNKLIFGDYNRSNINDLEKTRENERIFALITQEFGSELDKNEIGASYGEGGHGSVGGRKKRKRKTRRKKKKSSTRKRKRKKRRKSKKRRKKR